MLWSPDNQAGPLQLLSTSNPGYLVRDRHRLVLIEEPALRDKWQSPKSTGLGGSNRYHTPGK